MVIRIQEAECELEVGLACKASPLIPGDQLLPHGSSTSSSNRASSGVPPQTHESVKDISQSNCSSDLLTGECHRRPERGSPGWVCRQVIGLTWRVRAIDHEMGLKWSRLAHGFLV